MYDVEAKLAVENTTKETEDDIEQEEDPGIAIETSNEGAEINDGVIGHEENEHEEPKKKSALDGVYTRTRSETRTNEIDYMKLHRVGKQFHPGRQSYPQQ